MKTYRPNHTSSDFRASALRVLVFQHPDRGCKERTFWDRIFETKTEVITMKRGHKRGKRK